MLTFDPLLRPLVSRRPGLRIPGVWDVFECAVRGLLAQHMSVPAARRMAGRLVHRFGDRLADAADGLTHLFPSAERLAEADLRSIGLSASRAAALRGLARSVLDGELKLAGSPDEVASALTAIRGVGPWVAQYVALRALGEPDAFPSPATVATAGRAASWTPWRGYAALYLWQHAADAGAEGRFSAIPASVPPPYRVTRAAARRAYGSRRHTWG